jgi:hypothetical protein
VAEEDEAVAAEADEASLPLPLAAPSAPPSSSSLAEEVDRVSDVDPSLLSLPLPACPFIADPVTAAAGDAPAAAFAAATGAADLAELAAPAAPTAGAGDTPAGGSLAGRAEAGVGAPAPAAAAAAAAALLGRCA